MALTLSITLADDGQLKVEGIPTNKMMAYGLLKLAEVSITELFAANEKRVQPAPAGLILPKLD